MDGLRKVGLDEEGTSVEHKSKIVRLTHDDARFFRIPDDVKRDIVARIRACRRDVYPRYQAFQAYIADAGSIRNLPPPEAEIVSSMLVQLARAAAVWICTSCEHVVGLFALSPGKDAKTFLTNLLQVAAQEHPSCPLCGFAGWLFLRPSFLVSGLPLASMTKLTEDR